MLEQVLIGERPLKENIWVCCSDILLHMYLTIYCHMTVSRSTCLQRTNKRGNTYIVENISVMALVFIIRLVFANFFFGNLLCALIFAVHVTSK